MIPNKIYCGNNGHGNLSFSTERVYPSMEEYIRKDALFEMLKGYSHPLTRVVARELIEQINEL